MAASPTPPNLSTPPTPPQRSDSANFAARGDSFLSYIGTALITELRAALDWVRDALTDVQADTQTASTAAGTATTQAGVATTAAGNAGASASAAAGSATTATNQASASAASAAASLASQTAAAASAAAASTKATEAASSAAAAATSAANVGYADVTSVSAHNLTTGAKVFVVNEVRAYLPSLPVRLVHSGSVYMDGVITSISGKNVTVSVSQSYGAAGTYSPWAFAVLEGINAPTKTGGGASGSWGIDITGNAGTASALQTARSINGTNFSGAANITTASWGTARTVTIGGTAKSVDGSGSFGWTLTEMGVPSLTGAGATGTWNINISGNASSATFLATSRNINGTAFSGGSDITTSRWGTARTITIGGTAKSVDGSAAVGWTLSEMGVWAAITQQVPQELASMPVGALGTYVEAYLALVQSDFTQSSAPAVILGSVFSATRLNCAGLIQHAGYPHADETYQIQGDTFPLQGSWVMTGAAKLTAVEGFFNFRSKGMGPFFFKRVA